ncbi:hypothetical protein [Natronospira bacteriovora]|uniref:Apea-like HEPN domain-containing protein n=1 Tax=Natronospira bacteriovora TaxID=3069753 RepID=A0ABU0WA77_9GAMM|nr:hypothetical protein [Natronospira sp. AB-CW4]MDQ2070838.1 hypothetical protein [Natronospira sp. AB-CW4]
MQYARLTTWKNPSKLSGLAFFAQLTQELLFKYTSDGYKPPLMAVPSLVAEAIHVIDTVNAGLIDKQHVEHVCRELALRIKNDPVVKEMAPYSASTIAKTLKNSSTWTRRAHLEKLKLHLTPSAYKQASEVVLLTLLQRADRKRDISTVASHYFSNLMHLGYHETYLYAQSRQFFFLRKAGITKVADVGDYFALFPLEYQQYTVLFPLNSLMVEMIEKGGLDNITVESEGGSILLDEARKHGMTVKDGGAYGRMESVRARDVHSAYEAAVDYTSSLTDYLAFYHHKSALSPPARAIVQNEQTGKSRLIKMAPKPITCCPDSRPDSAISRTITTLGQVRARTVKDVEQLTQALALHAAAVRAEDNKGQLLNLWAALETLVSRDNGGNESHIESISRAIKPILLMTYLPSKLELLRKDLFRWDEGACRKYLDLCDGERDTEKLVHLLSSKGNEKNLRKLKADCGEFFLLRNRIFEIESLVTDAKTIRFALLSHWGKIEWQLRRIYRARNMIIHGSGTPGGLRVLVKNLHAYFDVCASSIISLLSKRETGGIDDSFVHSSLLWEDYYSHLEEISRSSVDTGNSLVWFKFDFG